MPTTALRIATRLALATALISGVNTFLTKGAVNAIGDPLLFTVLKNALVAVLLVGVAFALSKWREIRTLKRRQLAQLLAIGLVGGSLPFALFFIGLGQTSALNASLIHKTLFLWVALLAVPLLRERISRWQWLGVTAIAAANFLVGGFDGFRWNVGELLVLLATLLWAVENVIAKVALRQVSSLTVAAARMVIGSSALILYLTWRGSNVALIEVSVAAWGWTAVTSVLLLGYVLTWYAALKLAPATYVATLLTLATLVTNLLSAALVTHTLSALASAQALLFLVGVVLVIIAAERATCDDVTAGALAPRAT